MKLTTIIISIAMALAVWRLFKLGEKLTDKLQQLTEELKLLRESLASPQTNPPALNRIIRHLHGIAEFTQCSQTYAVNRRERGEQIMRNCAAQMQEEKGLTEQEALLKAEYIAQEFKEELERSEIHAALDFRGAPGQHVQKLATEFEGSSVLSKDIPEADDYVYILSCALDRS